MSVVDKLISLRNKYDELINELAKDPKKFQIVDQLSEVLKEIIKSDVGVSYCKEDDKVYIVPVGFYFDVTKTLHTPHCIQEGTFRECLRDEYRKQWPKFCTKCNAMGGHLIIGGWYEPDDFEECDKCFGIGLCPRCGLALSDPDEPISDKCSHCGWDIDNADHYAPQSYECSCYESAEEFGNDL